MSDKATGWKVPMLFATGIVLVAMVIYLFLPAAPTLAPLPETLLQKARATQVDLEKPENRRWKDAMVDAASGFASQESKDVKLLTLLRQAIGEGNLAAACAMAVLIKDKNVVSVARDDILKAAMASCDTLQYGVYAVQENEEMAARLRQRFEQCGGK